MATIVAIIQVIRLCHAVEKRLWPEKFAKWPLRNANVFAVAFNVRGVAQDEETQAMRGRMNRLLLVVLAGFALFGGLVFFAGLPAPQS